jgi:hypothetical protein
MMRCPMWMMWIWSVVGVQLSKYLNNRTSRYMQMLLERECANQLPVGPRSPQVL